MCLKVRDASICRMILPCYVSPNLKSPSLVRGWLVVSLLVSVVDPPTFQSHSHSAGSMRHIRARSRGRSLPARWAAPNAVSFPTLMQQALCAHVARGSLQRGGNPLSVLQLNIMVVHSGSIMRGVSARARCTVWGRPLGVAATQGNNRAKVLFRMVMGVAEKAGTRSVGLAEYAVV